MKKRRNTIKILLILIFIVTAGVFITNKTSAQTTWIPCGLEGDTCSFLGTQTVRYGAKDTDGIYKYLYKTATNSTECNTSAFGTTDDPVPFVKKSCDYGGSQPAPAQAATGSLIFTASPANITSGQSSVLSFKHTTSEGSLDVPSGSSCIKSGGDSDWSGNLSYGHTYNIYNTNPLTTTTTYTMTCQGSDINAYPPITKSVTVTVGAENTSTAQQAIGSLTFAAYPAYISSGQSSTLYWKYNTSAGLDSVPPGAICVKSGGGPGWSNLSSSYTTATSFTGPLTTTTTYTMTCRATGYAPITKSATVTIGTAPAGFSDVRPPTRGVEVLSLVADKTFVDYGTSATITWKYTTNATSNVLVVGECSKGGVNWSGQNQPTSGTFNTGPLTETKTYSMTCATGVGSFAWDERSVTINVKPQKRGTLQKNISGRTVQTEGADNITATTAVLRGLVGIDNTYKDGCTSAIGYSTTTGKTCNKETTSSGLDATAYFRYSASLISPVFCNDIYGSNMISTKDIPLGKVSYASFYQPIKNLTPDTEYYYCAIVSNKKGIAYESGQSIVKHFHTNCYDTTVDTKDATNVGSTSATLNGSYCSTLDVETSFIYQELPDNPTAPQPSSITVGNTNHSMATNKTNTSGNFSFKISGLKTNTRYQFQAIAKNRIGPFAYSSKDGSQLNFTTNPPKIGTSNINGGGFDFLDFGINNLIGTGGFNSGGFSNGGFGNNNFGGGNTTPGGNTSGGNTPSGTTPGGNTPGGTTPGGNTPGGTSGGTGGGGGSFSFSGSNINNVNVTNTTVSSGSISNVTISSGSMSNATISNVTMNGGKISNATISSGKISNATISSGKISNSTISNSTISNIDISNSNVSNGNINNADISNGNISSGNISNADINNANITSGDISSGNISNADINNANITAGKITNSTVTSGTVNNVTVTGATVTTASGNITNATITGADITGVTVDNNGNITAGTITNGTISNGTISNGTISNGTITNGTISNGTITNGTISNGVTTGGAIVTNVNNGTWNGGAGSANATSGTWGTGTGSGSWTATSGVGGGGTATWTGSGNGTGTWNSPTGSGTWSNGTGTGGAGTGTWGNLVLGQKAIPPNDAIVRYHEGIETVFTRQIINNPIYQKTYGYQAGDDLLTFAWNLSDQFAKMFGYIDKNGKEIRVSFPDIAAYQLQLIGNKLTVYEYYAEKIVNIRNLTTVFKNASGYEYYFKK